jgi:hypothetical protein
VQRATAMRQSASSAAGQRDHLLAGGRLADHRDAPIGLEQQTDAGAHQRLAVGDQHPNGLWCSLGAKAQSLHGLDHSELATTCEVARSFARRDRRGTRTEVRDLIAAASCLNGSHLHPLAPLPRQTCLLSHTDRSV